MKIGCLPPFPKGRVRLPQPGRLRRAELGLANAHGIFLIFCGGALGVLLGSPLWALTCALAESGGMLDRAIGGIYFLECTSVDWRVPFQISPRLIGAIERARFSENREGGIFFGGFSLQTLHGGTWTSPALLEGLTGLTDFRFFDCVAAGGFDPSHATLVASCRCDCGAIVSVRGDHLRRGETTTCPDCWYEDLRRGGTTRLRHRKHQTSGIAPKLALGAAFGLTTSPASCRLRMGEDFVSPRESTPYVKCRCSGRQSTVGRRPFRTNPNSIKRSRTLGSNSVHVFQILIS